MVADGEGGLNLGLPLKGGKEGGVGGLELCTYIISMAMGGISFFLFLSFVHWMFQTLSRVIFHDLDIESFLVMVYIYRKGGFKTTSSPIY